jgi:hypothetical protein
MKRLFPTFVCLLVALPLGVGGFCCCLMGHGPGAAPVVAAESHSCCSADESAASPPAGEEAGCDCPARDLAVVAKAAAGSPDAAPMTGELVFAAPPVSMSAAPARAAVSPLRHPPPLQSLDRTFSVLRC